MHDLEDFSLGETNRVLGLINAAHEQHPRSKIAITIEIKASVSISKAKSNSHKRKAPDTDLENSSPIPSSPPVSAEKKKSNRTSKLAEQQAIRLDKIAQAGDFERQLADKWICRDKGCTNQDAYCFPDPQDSRTHYSITAVQQKSWAQAISAGECTLQQPPIKIWLYWKSDQGPITRDSRTSGRKTFQQETKDSLENLNEQVERARLQSQLVAEQDKLMQRAEREEDRQYRREEREEERQARRQEQEAERRRRKDQEDRERQRRQQEEDAYKQFTYNRHPFSLHSLPPSQQQPFFPSLPFSHPQHFQHSSIMTPGFQNPLFGPSLPVPLPQPQAEICPTSRKSSPISSELADNQILRRFFNHKMIGQSPEVTDKWQRVWRIVDTADWSIDDLKEMEDGKSAMYQRAIAAGISDGFARRFGSELRAFKQVYREQEEAANTLRMAGGFL
jgi:hypothetical protein